MSTWSQRSDDVLRGRGTHHLLLADGVALSWRRVLALLGDDPSFRRFLSLLLAGSAFKAFRFETPPLRLGGLDQTFEFVLVDDPYLEVAPEPTVFAGYFVGPNASAPALAVPNLGRSAMMVVPRQIGAAAAYAHVARFVRFAPAAQQHALWQLVATTALSRLSARPMWVSTAGGGVAWLHVRIENVPKYYSYRPYAHGSWSGTSGHAIIGT